MISSIDTRSPKVISFYALMWFIARANDRVALAIGLDLAKRYFCLLLEVFEELARKRMEELKV
ncbi:MAG: hypothetical protein FVQ79_04190 [Planctomycetes bacterium]|nr:hypothetical protein [Planctomycetota bacterium]